ncbi:hypothetical protein F4809DRAFT_251970 [Biscogniauxia mediterranea]|nr:hypothetical protein F4809DRAFT_251970 [Biscogniauxia mediterranea]
MGSRKNNDKSDVLLEQVTNLFLQLKKDFINDIISRRNRIERRQSQTNQPVATIDHNGPNEGHHQVAGPHLNYLSRPTTASDHSMRDKRQAPLNHETASQSFVILNNSTLQPNDDSPEEIQEPNTGSPNVPPMMSALSPQIVQPPNDTFQASPHLKPPNLKDIPSSILPRLSSSRLRRPCLSLWQRSFIRDGQSEELEAYYLESAPSTPRRLPLGHKQLTRVLKHIAKTGKDDLGVQYLSLNPGQREAVDMIIQEANRSGSRLKTCIAISVDLMGLFLVVFLSLGEPIDPVYLKFADRVFCFSFELCRTWQGMEKLIHSALGDDPMIGRRVHEGYYDLLTFDSHTILPEVWESVVTPGWNLLLLIRDPPLVDSGPDKLHDQPEWSPKPISPGSIYPPGHQRAGPLSRPPTLGLTGSRAMRMGNDSSSSSSSSPGPPDLPGRAGSDGLDGSAGPTGPPGRDSRDGSPDWLHRSAALGQPLCASFKYHDSMILGSAINYPDTGEDKEESDSINFEAEKQKTDQLQVDDLLRRWTHAADNPHEDDDDDVSTTHATSSNDSNKQN